MVKSFSASVNDFIDLSKKQMEAVVRQSVQDVVDIAQKPVGKGGKMRVDTGFLRASGQMSLSGMPVGPVRPSDDATPGQYQPDATNVIVTLGKYQLGDTIYFGWTANYAKYREVFDGFLISAVQNWPAIVVKNTKSLQK